MVNVIVANDVTSLPNVPNKINLSFNSNTSIFEMKVEIAKQFKCSWNEMALIRVRFDLEIGDDDNGRSIGDMRFQNTKKEAFTVTICNNLLIF